ISLPTNFILNNDLLAHQRLFVFNDTATTAIYTLSLHDALPILQEISLLPMVEQNGAWTWWEKTLATGNPGTGWQGYGIANATAKDRKSTRLNSSHVAISYAVFCLKKKKKNYQRSTREEQN